MYKRQTVGVSAVISPDGRVSQPTELFTAAQIVETVEATSGLTPSDRLGPWVEWMSGIALLLLVAAGRRGSRRARVVPSPTTDLETTARA